jgi:hypothetical protein
MIFVNGTTMNLMKAWTFTTFSDSPNSSLLTLSTLPVPYHLSNAPRRAVDATIATFCLSGKQKSKWRPELSSLKYHANLFA